LLTNIQEYSTYSTTQHLKLILGNNFPFFFFSFISAVLDQVPELSATETQLPLPSFEFFPQFGERAFLFEQVAHQ